MTIRVTVTERKESKFEVDEGFVLNELLERTKRKPDNVETSFTVSSASATHYFNDPNVEIKNDAW